MIELAIATQTPVSAWVDESSEVIATALAILHEQNEARKR